MVKGNMVVFITLLLFLYLYVTIELYASAEKDSGQVPDRKTWTDDFKLVEIGNPNDGEMQKAYFYKSTEKNMPLVVSLHTWSAGYSQLESSVAFQTLDRNWNFIHPDFRGPNNKPDACCSEKVMEDIDFAIDYALENTDCDRNRIYVLGGSGGGHATFCTFMKSRHRINTFSAWVGISDLVAWYNHCKAESMKYADDVMKCTGSSSALNIEEAQKRSPLYMDTPVEKLEKSKLHIYAGIQDGYVKGSVPTTNSMLFYNKALRDLGVEDESYYISEKDMETLKNQQSPMETGEKIGGRDVLYKKEFRNVRLIIFDGHHEILSDAVLDTFD